MCRNINSLQTQIERRERGMESEGQRVSERKRTRRIEGERERDRQKSRKTGRQTGKTTARNKVGQNEKE